MMRIPRMLDAAPPNDVNLSSERNETVSGLKTGIAFANDQNLPVLIRQGSKSQST